MSRIDRNQCYHYYPRMNREIVMAAICTVATIAVAWIIDHPSKVGGTIMTLVVFAIIVGGVWLRGDRDEHTAKWNRHRRSSRTPPE